MPLPESTRSEVVNYALADLPGDLAWHVSYFDFIGDSDLRGRLGQEFYAARCLYKLWEGLRIDEQWARQAQVQLQLQLQLQVQQYASIYEASVHHLLFVEAADEPIVQRLNEYRALVQRLLPGHIMDRIRRLDAEDANDIVGAVLATRRAQESKIRFAGRVLACETGMTRSARWVRMRSQRGGVPLSLYSASKPGVTSC